MKQMTTDVKVINRSDYELPTYQTEGSAGMDIKSNEKSFYMAPLERRLVRTGLYIQLPKQKEAQVRPRSGLALKSGITVLNSPGTIDSDYTGEIGVILINLSNVVVEIEKGTRIAQLVIASYDQAQWLPVEELDDTSRGSDGFGSTGEN